MKIDLEKLKIIDLSLPIDENEKNEPFPVRISRLGHKHGIQYLNHSITFNKHLNFFKKIKSYFSYLSGKRKFRSSDFPDDEFISDEKIFSSVHVGTHVDAPYHFGSRCAGKKAKQIEELPLETFIGKGVVLDVSHCNPGSLITKQDIINACQKIEYEIKSNDIVLIKTNASKLWNSKEYFFKFPGMSREATEFILDKGVKLIGIDALGFDLPYKVMIEGYFKNRDKTILWASHFLGREKEYYHIERLANLEAIPDVKNFIFCGFPIKILNVGASWIRAVAFIEK